MKKFTYFFLILFMSFNQFIVLAQKSGFKLTVADRTLGGEDGPVFVLEVDRAKEEDVALAWNKLIEKKTKVKSQKKNGETFIQNIIIESISPDPISIYSAAVQQDTSVRLYAVFIVDSARVDPNGKEGTPVKVRRLLAKFGTEVYSEVLEREHNEKMDYLKELEKEHEKILKEQDNLNKKIQQDSLKIFSSETSIEQLKEQLDNTNKRYNAQKNRMAGARYSSKDDEKEAKAVLKGIDKERKKIEKEIQNHSNNILKLKADIRDHLFRLDQLATDLKLNEEKISGQRVAIRESEDEIRKYETSKKSIIERIFN